MYNWQEINWSNYNDRVSPHFTVHEALFLPSWRIYHMPSDEEKQEIVKTADVMERIRNLFSQPISIHCWMRPLKVNNPSSERHGQNYNRFIGSRATRSAHIFGKAVDFHVNGYQGPSGCANVRQRLIPYLEGWNIRMEDKEGGWIHIDTNPVVSSRFFKP